MQDFKDKVAVITGGASGIGLGLARAFAEQGMRIALLDIERDALDGAVASLGADALGVPCDVTDRDAVFRAADQVIAAFGAVHLLCNNAGVAAGGPTHQLPMASWNWVIDVNFKGVVHGIQAFLPHIQAHGGHGHVVNTASIAGLRGFAKLGPYTASKFAVIGISEGLAEELADTPIGVSVLCPAWVRTGIGASARNRQVNYGKGLVPTPSPMASEFTAAIAAGLDPALVGQRVLEAIRAEELYIFTHPAITAEILDARAARLDTALAAARDSAALGGGKV